MIEKDRYLFKFIVGISLLSLIILYGIPILVMIKDSFYSQNALGSDKIFVGIENYEKVFSDISLLQPLIASVVFTLLSVILQISVALLAAVLTQKSFRGVDLLRWVFILPYFFSTIVVIIAWQFFTNPVTGILSPILNFFNLPLLDLRSPQLALPTMVLVSTYEAFPFCYALILAKLLQIPNTYYDLAKLDGANSSKCFFVITWPQIKNVIMGLILLRIVITSLKFDVPWLVYSFKASSKWSDTFSVWVYRTAFELLNYGKAYASTIIILSSLAIIVYIYKIIDRNRAFKL